MATIVFSFDQCTSVLNLGAEVGCVISEGPWLLVGMPNLVKVSYKFGGISIVFLDCHNIEEPALLLCLLSYSIVVDK